MKQILHIILVSFPFWLASCYEDKGNYTYRDKQPIQIDSIAESYQGMSGIDTLRISPVIVSQNPIARYEWSVYKATEHVTEEIVLDSVSAELCYPIALTQGIYTLLFKVTDDEGYTEIATTEFDVRTEFSEGWLVLKELDGNTDLDLYPTGKNPAYNLFSKLYGQPLQGKPVNLSMYPKAMYSDSEGKPGKGGFAIFPISEEESPLIQLSDMQRIFNFDELFYEGPQDGEKALKYLYLGFSAGTSMITDRYARANQTLGAAGSGKRGAPAVTSKNENRFSKFAIADSYSGRTIMYDELNGDFLTMAYFGSSADIFTPPATDKMPVKPFGLNCRMVFMKGNCKNITEGYAVLEHKENRERYVFEMKKLYGSMSSNPISAVDTLSADLKINEASVFSLHGTLPYLYYAVGNDCYLYDAVNRMEEKLDLINTDKDAPFDGNEEITAVEHIFWNGGAPKWEYLVVATHADGHYKLYLYPLRGGRPDLSEKVILHQGEGKAAYIHYAMPKMGSGYISLSYYPYN